MAIGTQIAADNIKLKRACAAPEPSDGTRILIDRLWPRGVKKTDAAIDRWLKEIAPSAGLRRWFGHRSERWPEFRRRYLAELKERPQVVEEVRAATRDGPVTLVYAARDERHNDAVVLQELLERATGNGSREDRMADTQENTLDLENGIPEGDLADGAMLVGQVGGEAVLLARRGAEVFAIGAACTHYGGPLGEGLMVEDTVRCPWHHACFSLRTGEALAAPALNANSCWRVERRDGRIFVREKISESGPRMPAKPRAAAGSPEHIVIVGGGAAGYAAAETLRREGYGGGLALVSADEAAPYDRPNLSKDYLAGTAPEEWIPLRPFEFYTENGIELRLGATASAIDVAGRRVILASGDALKFDKLLLATGAEPIRLETPGADLPHVRVLRSLADSRELISRAQKGTRAIVVGASFIGLEAAAALRHRDVEVHVVAPEARPMERALGPVLGDFLRSLHESHGVIFHLGHTVARIEPAQVQLDDGTKIDSPLVVVGIGVRPRLDLARQAGLQIDRGVLVDEYLETSAPGIFAAGDIACWPDRYSGERLRIEHWVVAERQGQTAARNMLDRRERYTVVPFFWSQHYDVSIDYVGHAAAWDNIAQDGDPNSHDVAMRFRKGSRTLAVATIFRGRESLLAELAMEQDRSP